MASKNAQACFVSEATVESGASIVSNSRDFAKTSRRTSNCWDAISISSFTNFRMIAACFSLICHVLKALRRPRQLNLVR